MLTCTNGHQLLVASALTLVESQWHGLFYQPQLPIPLTGAGFPFHPVFHVQGWPAMPSGPFVPQPVMPPSWGQPQPGHPQAPPPMPFPGQPPSMPPMMPGPERPPQPQPGDEVPEVEETDRNHPNPGPSGPEHESEADIIPARPDDGSGGGPTSATPGRPMIAGGGGFDGRIAKERVTNVGSRRP